VDDEGVDAEVVDPSLNHAIGEVAALLAELRKLNPHAEDVIKTYAGLVIQMGKHSVEQFEKMSKTNQDLLKDNATLVGVILDLHAQYKDFNLKVVQVHAEERTKQQGIRSAEKVVVETLSKLDPDLLNKALQAVLDFASGGKQETD
jgi:hypothetical protein